MKLRTKICIEFYRLFVLQSVYGGQSSQPDIYYTCNFAKTHSLTFFAYENLWRHIWQCLQLYANTCNYGNACKKMQIHGNICKYVRIHGNARKCAKTCINICRFILSSLTYACNRGCCCIKSKWHLLCTSQPRWYRHEKLLTDEINQMGYGRLFSSKVLTDEQDWLMSGSNWQLT